MTRRIKAPGREQRVNGYASYKVANTVTSHQAYGLGVYGVFQYLKRKML